jgi:hypothetical protein
MTEPGSAWSGDMVAGRLRPEEVVARDVDDGPGVGDPRRWWPETSTVAQARMMAWRRGRRSGGGRMRTGRSDADGSDFQCWVTLYQKFMVTFMYKSIYNYGDRTLQPLFLKRYNLTRMHINIVDWMILNTLHSYIMAIT